MLKMGVVGMGIGGSHGARIHKSDLGELAAICDKDGAKLKWRLETYAREIGCRPHGSPGRTWTAWSSPPPAAPTTSWP